VVFSLARKYCDYVFSMTKIVDFIIKTLNTSVVSRDFKTLLMEGSSANRDA
jgi:hypothetical protein